MNGHRNIESDWRRFNLVAKAYAQAKEEGQPEWFYDPEGIARLANRSVGTIRAWIADGTLPSIPSPWKQHDRAIHIYALAALAHKPRRAKGGGRKKKPVRVSAEELDALAEDGVTD
jgi:hypothetical protein